MKVGITSYVHVNLGWLNPALLVYANSFKATKLIQLDSDRFLEHLKPVVYLWAPFKSRRVDALCCHTRQNMKIPSKVGS